MFKIIGGLVGLIIVLCLIENLYLEMIIMMEELLNKHEQYCENKECDRICRTEEFVDCLLKWLLNNYDVVPKKINNSIY